MTHKNAIALEYLSHAFEYLRPRMQNIGLSIQPNHEAQAGSILADAMVRIVREPWEDGKVNHD